MFKHHELGRTCTPNLLLRVNPIFINPKRLVNVTFLFDLDDLVKFKKHEEEHVLQYRPVDPQWNS